MEIAQTILLGLILIAVCVIIWQSNRESAIPFEFKRKVEKDRYI